MDKPKASFALHHIELVDPYTGKTGPHHLVIEEGVITRLSQSDADLKNFKGPHYDGKGWMVSPGFCDPHVHFRDPGFLEKETIETGSRAAAAGGFTDVACMANTQPVNDNLTTLGYIQYKASQVPIGIHPICAVTQNLEGRSLVAFEQLLKAGAIAFSDDGAILQNEKVLLQALKRCSELEALLIAHCETPSLSHGTKVNASRVAFDLGLPGNPGFSEGLSVFTHLYLAQQAQARIHIAHVSSATALPWIEHFHSQGVLLSCEVTPHHLLLTDEKLLTGEGRFVVSPPLRSHADRQQLQQALKTGLIDCIATDHAPHTPAEKTQGLESAPPGMIGLETALSVLWHLVKEKVLTKQQLVTRLSQSPRKLLQLPPNPIQERQVADLVIFEETKPYVFNEKDLYSKSQNCPFLGTEGLIRIHAVIAKGKLVHVAGKTFRQVS